MKKTLVLFVALVAAHSASANTVIADNMKQIGALVKGIATTASDPAQNAKNAADAGKLVPLFEAVLNAVPDAITTLPTSQQGAATADYQSLIQDEINDAKALQADFQNGDNAGAAKVLADMAAQKKTGHTKYNPSTN